MSDYGPPTDEQISQFRGSQNRTANWVNSHCVPAASRPAPSRSSSYSSSQSSSRSRTTSLPPPPPGFKYAPANAPVVYKTQAATYTVVHPSTRTSISGTSSRSHSRSSSATAAPRRTHTYPVVTYQTPHQSYPAQTPAYYYPQAPRSKPKEKEQPLLRRLFGMGDGNKKPESRPRRHSSSGHDSTITIQW